MKFINRLEKELQEKYPRTRKTPNKKATIDMALIGLTMILTLIETTYASFVYFYTESLYLSIPITFVLFGLYYYFSKASSAKNYMGAYPELIFIASAMFGFWIIPKTLHYVGVVDKQKICFVAHIQKREYDPKTMQGSITFASKNRAFNQLKNLDKALYDSIAKESTVTVCGTLSQIGFAYSEIRDHWQGEENYNDTFIFAKRD